MNTNRRRVVVTGMGVISSLGGLPDFWEALVNGTSGIRTITFFDTSDHDCHVAGEVDFDPDHYGLEHKEIRRMGREAQMAKAAARLALDDAGLDREALAPESARVGVSMGTVNAGFAMLLESVMQRHMNDRRIRPTSLVNGLPNMPAHYISADAGAEGPLFTVSAACASGTQSIGLAADLLRVGRADVIIAGGVDCLVHDDVMKGFEAMGVLPTSFNDRPAQASRPFDADREGFVMGEGAGILILETLAHARARSARMYAEVLGSATSSDAQHSAAPDSEGQGALHAMQWALDDAGVNPPDVDYINAHGTGTAVNDAVETLAIKRLFGDAAAQIPINSSKSMIGHCMGGSGALEAVACILSIRDNVVHPTINLATPDPDCDLDYVPGTARDVPVRVALSNSFGLGGQNACLVLGALG